MEEEFTIEKAIQVFKQRIEDLTKYESITEKDIDKIRNEKVRGLARVSKNTLELNKNLLNTFMEPINTRMY